MWEYLALLPNVPDQRNDLQVRLFFEPTPRYLAVYMAMTKLGYSTDEAGCHLEASRKRRCGRGHVRVKWVMSSEVH